MKEFLDLDEQDIVIDVRNVEKQFKSYKDKATSFKERFVNPSRTKHEDIMVLNGISFGVKRGEAIGLIGKNGCGKSTILKLLSKILHPNKGEIVIKGRVSSLIELGAGFHPDMTGRENIYTNASIFGITRKEVDQRLNDIIRFSELEEFIDNPVRTYSSGMYMRLAFAVAINVDADVLLIDEILAVGDSGFQKKCFEKLKEIKAKGTTIVIVSHSMDQMYRICDRLLWIENGVIRDEGVPKFIGEEYLAAMEGRRLNRMELENRQKKEELEKKIQEKEEEKNRLSELEELEKNETLKTVSKYCYPGARRRGKGEIHYTQVVLKNTQGDECSTIITGEKYVIEMEYEASDPQMKGNFVIGITRVDGVYCYGSFVNVNETKEVLLQKKGRIQFTFCNALLKGKYLLDLWIETADGYQYDCIYSLMQFEVETCPYRERGILTMAHEWYVDDRCYSD